MVNLKQPQCKACGLRPQVLAINMCTPVCCEGGSLTTGERCRVHIDVGVAGQHSAAAALGHDKHAVGVVSDVDLGENASRAGEPVVAAVNVGSGGTREVEHRHGDPGLPSRHTRRARESGYTVQSV